MIEIKEITNPNEKQEIFAYILNQLNYSDAKELANPIDPLPFWGVFDRGNAVGFLAMKEHDEIWGELFAIGILEDYQRISIGRGLFNLMQNYAMAKGLGYLFVRLNTISNPENKGIFKFLHSMGFVDFEAMGIEAPPALLEYTENLSFIMMKDLKNYNNSYKCKTPEELNEQR